MGPESKFRRQIENLFAETNSGSGFSILLELTFTQSSVLTFLWAPKQFFVATEKNRLCLVTIESNDTTTRNRSGTNNFFFECNKVSSIFFCREQGWASNFGRLLLDLDFFRDPVVLEYLNIEYLTPTFCQCTRQVEFYSISPDFPSKIKLSRVNRVLLDITWYTRLVIIKKNPSLIKYFVENRGQVYSTIEYSARLIFNFCRLDYSTWLDPTWLDFGVVD